VTDIGEANIEELNIVEKGGDYGWPVMEGDFGITTTKEMKKVYDVGKADLLRFKRPFLQYDHEEGNAISGGYVYEGNLTPLKNKYVFGDIVNGKLFYASIDPQLTDSTIYQLAIIENGKETSLREMCNTKRLHQRVSYDRYQKDLYIITKADGKIWRLKKAYP
jgi:glucose/arabinose dehydrogenase